MERPPRALFFCPANSDALTRAMRILRYDRASKRDPRRVGALPLTPGHAIYKLPESSSS